MYLLSSIEPTTVTESCTQVFLKWCQSTSVTKSCMKCEAVLTDQLRDLTWHRSGMSHSTTASPKASFGAPSRMGDAVVGGGYAR